MRRSQVAVEGDVIRSIITNRVRPAEFDGNYHERLVSVLIGRIHDRFEFRVTEHNRNCRFATLGEEHGAVNRQFHLDITACQDYLEYKSFHHIDEPGVACSSR